MSSILNVNSVDPQNFVNYLNFDVFSQISYDMNLTLVNIFLFFFLLFWGLFWHTCWQCDPRANFQWEFFLENIILLFLNIKTIGKNENYRILNKK